MAAGRHDTTLQPEWYSREPGRAAGHQPSEHRSAPLCPSPVGDARHDLSPSHLPRHAAGNGRTQRRSAWPRRQGSRAARYQARERTRGRRDQPRDASRALPAAQRSRCHPRSPPSRQPGWHPASSPPAATAALSPAPPAQSRARTVRAATHRVRHMNPGQSGPSAQTPIWEEPVRGFYTDPGQFVALSGLDLLRSMLEDGLGPPIRYLFGLAPTSVEPGGVTFTMPVTDWLLFPQGVVSGATLGILVDAPLGCAVQTALPSATPFTTAEISLRFLRTVVPQSGTLTARGRLIHAGKTTGVSLVEVTDQAGRMIAITSTRCAIFPPVQVPPEVIEEALKHP